MKRIAIDTTFFGHNEAESHKLSLSTSIFTYDILHALEGAMNGDYQAGSPSAVDSGSKAGASKEFDITLLINSSHRAFMEELFPHYTLKEVTHPLLNLLERLSRGKFKTTKLIKKLGIYTRVLNKGGFDLVWFPFCIDRTFVSSKVPSLCTFHDIYGLHRDHNEADWHKIVKEARGLTCISDYTRKDIMKSLGYKDEIPVIPNSVVFLEKEEEAYEALTKDGKALPYILDINAYIPKKNTMTLLKAYRTLDTEALLVLCGGYKDESYMQEITDYIKAQGLESRVKLLYRIPEKQKNWLLNHAKLFVTPSLFEGFGRTPVEAAVSKIPVISTRETSLEEATMSLCHYVDNATSPEEYTALMKSLLENPDTEERLTEIKNTLMKRYDPMALKEEYLKCFRKLLK